MKNFPYHSFVIPGNAPLANRHNFFSAFSGYDHDIAGRRKMNRLRNRLPSVHNREEILARRFIGNAFFDFTDNAIGIFRIRICVGKNDRVGGR